jgi:hypothetical protein
MSNTPENQSTESQPATPPVIDVPHRLIVRTCPTCKDPFAISAALFVACCENAIPIRCPAGHAHAVEKDEAEKSIAMIVAAAIAELAQAKVDLDTAHRQLARCLPRDGGEVDKKELKRRCYMLAEHAELTAYGRRLCPFCGKPSANIRKHLEAAHAAEVKERPAAAFA